MLPLDSANYQVIKFGKEVISLDKKRKIKFRLGKKNN